ncbi:MAG: response regulator [Flavobacteriaceae bacterium]|nr:response regulator [Flavobacteriaceae bacterium]
MEKIRAIIIDDEQGARNVLANLLERLNDNISVVSSNKNLVEGVEAIKLMRPDVVFLDVQMPNYAGYEIIDFFDTIDFEIIFVTAYDEYAVKAFELNAIDYLVKPINRKKLSDSIDKLKDKVLKKKVFVDYQNLIDQIRGEVTKKIVIPELGNRRIVNLNEIIAIEADGAYVKLYLKNNKLITASKNLKFFEDKLSSEVEFLRTHRAWIINIDYIELLNKSERIITLAKGRVRAKISRTRIEYFENLLAGP